MNYGIFFKLIILIYFILLSIGLIILCIILIKKFLQFLKKLFLVIIEEFFNINFDAQIKNNNISNFKIYEDKFNKNKDYVINYYKNSNTNNNPSTTETTAEEDYKKYYIPKIYLITLNELVFHNILMEIAKELDLILCSQVSLYNIIETRKGLDKSTETKYFNKIAKKSIDFVLVDKKDCRIRLCIELDDLTHRKYKRIERDKFVNELFKSLNINLLRIPSKFHYNKEELKNTILENLNTNYYEKESY